MSKGSTVAFYARVSSEAQAHAHTIDSQVAALKERITADGFRLEPEGVDLSAQRRADRARVGRHSLDEHQRRAVRHDALTRDSQAAPELLLGRLTCDAEALGGSDPGEDESLGLLGR